MTGPRAALGGSGLALLATLVAALPATAAGQAAAGVPSRCAGEVVTKLVDPAKGVAVGGSEDEVIAGTSAADKISARRGNDRACGLAARDRLRAGRGHDVLRGGRHADRLAAGPGRDRARGGAGRDRIRGSSGRDRIRGGAGIDRAIGGTGPDKIDVADDARDRVAAGPGDDTVISRDGEPDLVECGSGFDTATVDRADAVRGCEAVDDGSAPAFAIPSWADGVWDTRDKYTTIQAGDIDGDGADELIGRGPFGIEAYDFDPNTGQWLPLYPGADPGFSDNQNWDSPQYYSTIQLGDVDGDGADELLARSSTSLIVSSYDPQTATWSQTNALSMSDEEGFDDPSWYSTIQLADFDGNGNDDLIARKSDGLHVYFWQNGVFQEFPESAPVNPFLGNQFPNSTKPDYYSTIQPLGFGGCGPGCNIIDDVLFRRVAPGGEAQVVSMGTDSNVVAGWSVDFNFPFGTSQQGFDDPDQYSTIKAANVYGNSREEVLARESDGLHVYVTDPETDQGDELTVLDALSDANGFSKSHQYETIQVADVDGDGDGEVLARQSDGIHIYKLSGAEPGKWSELTPATTFSDANNWNEDQYADTIQVADVAEGTKTEPMLLGRGPTGIQSVTQGGGSDAWASPTAQFPQFNGNAGQAAAYKAINDSLGRGNTGWTDLREEYGQSGSSAQLKSWETGIKRAEIPLGIAKADWDKVTNQLLGEIDTAQPVATWYEDTLHDHVADTYALGQNTVSSVMNQSADTLDAADDSGAVELWEGMATLLDGAATLAEASGNEEASWVMFLGADAMDLSAGLGAEGIEAAEKSINAGFAELTGDMGQAFQAALQGNTKAEREVLGDYGLQQATEQFISNGFWSEGDEEPQLQSANQLQFTRWAWQTFTPAVWTVYHYGCDPDVAPDLKTSSTSCYILAATPARKVDPSTGAYYVLGEEIKESVLEQLTGEVTCTTTWNASNCDLGVELADVILGRGGWHLDQAECVFSPGRVNPFRCSAPK